MRPAPLISRLLLVAHGSADPRYPATIEAIADLVRSRTQVPVVTTYLDHLEPRLASVSRAGDVVVPLLLAPGFHTGTDIPAAAPDAVVTGPLGPDPRLAIVCAERLAETGAALDGRVLLAAAGSSDPAGASTVAAIADELQAELVRRGNNCTVRPAYLSTGSPLLGDVVTATDTVATFLLAPGRFADQAESCGAEVVSRVLGAHPLIADIVLDRLAAATI